MLDYEVTVFATLARPIDEDSDDEIRKEEQTLTVELDDDEYETDQIWCGDDDGYYCTEYYPDKDILYDRAREAYCVPTGWELIEFEVA